MSKETTPLLEPKSRPVAPLGVFGVVAGQPELDTLRPEIVALVGQIPEHERSSIAKYLRSGSIVFSIMEYTTDVVGAFSEVRRDKLRPGIPILEAVGGKFGVEGGSAILTDGAYYWRRDAAEYVEHYGTGLPEDFLRHGRALGWVAPLVSAEDLLAVDRYLMQHARRMRHAQSEGERRGG